jgi:hypothetical protein
LREPVGRPSARKGIKEEVGDGGKAGDEVFDLLEAAELLSAKCWPFDSLSPPFRGERVGVRDCLSIIAAD